MQVIGHYIEYFVQYITKYSNTEQVLLMMAYYEEYATQT